MGQDVMTCYWWFAPWQQNQVIFGITTVTETEIQFYYEVFVAWHSAILEN